MNEFNKNQVFNVCYSVSDRSSGLTVVFDIWDESGALLDTGIGGDEIDAKGIYNLSYKAPNTDTYLLIKGQDLQKNHKAASFVIQVGSPVKKFWYVSKKNEEGLTINYEVYDFFETVLQSGIATHAVSGFYFADISALSGICYVAAFPLTEVTSK